jgi:thioesterase domain-containing protein
MSGTKSGFIAMLHKDIPLTQAMGIEYNDYSQNSLCLRAPLSLNANHKDTFFGGSLYTLAVTTAWGLMYLKVQELGFTGHVVINEGKIGYNKPVAGDCLSRCTISDEQVNRLYRQFSRRGKAVMNLDVVFGESLDMPQGNFSGRYAVV